MTKPNAPDAGSPRASGDPDSGRSERRSFTDVVSLFQPIVPAAGAPVRAKEPVPMPPPAQIGTEPGPVGLPPAAAPTPPRARQPAPPEPEPQPAVPWPEALEPQPNWRRPSIWSWLLLVPLGFGTAALMLLVDPGSVRSLVNRHILQPLTTLPATMPPQEGQVSPAPVETPSARSEPTPAAAASPPTASDHPIPEPDEPRFSNLTAPVTAAPPPEAAAAPPPPAASPVPAPPPPAAAPPAPPAPPPAPVQPAPAQQAAVAPSFGQVVIRYRKQTGADAEAAQIAAELRPMSASVETRPASGSYRVPTVVYFRSEDRGSALSLAQHLGGAGRAWDVHAGRARGKAGNLEVWLP